MIKQLTLSALLASGIVHADTLGGEFFIGVYSHSPSGYASYTDPYFGYIGTTADIEDTLHWKSNENIFLKAYIEHPVPMLPNVKIAYTQLSHEGQGAVSNDFVWGGIHIPSFGTIDNNLDISQYDLTLYYELLDNWVEADAGITLGYIDGHIEVTALSGIGPYSLSHTEYTDFSLFLPTLYGKIKFNIPTTDISLQFEGNALKFDDTTFYNYELSARYTFDMGLGIEAGYKTLHLDSEDLADGLTVDMDFDGPYAAVVWDF
jgi:outer membrane protein